MYLYHRVTLAQHPEIKRLVLAACPGYKKRTASIVVTESVTLSGRYWDGGTKREYTAVNLSTAQVSHAPEINPMADPRHAGADKVVPPKGAGIVCHGVFCGKTAEAYLYLHPASTDMLPAPSRPVLPA